MQTPLGARWALREGLPRVLLNRAARRGDLPARLTVEPALRANPFAAYEQLRAAGPLLKGPLSYTTVDHGVASEVLRSPDFGVGADSFFASPIARRLARMTVDGNATGPVDPPSMLAVDPPDHTRYRRLVSKVFTARAVAGLTERVQEIADRLLDQLADQGDGVVDLVAAYAGQLPVEVITDVLGLPERYRGNMLEWGAAGATLLDPGLSYATYARAQRSLRDVHRMLGEHLADLRRKPGTDLFSQLVAVEDEGQRLNDVELRTTALLVIGAGFETTVNLIGSGVTDLLAHPDQLEHLLAEPAVWANAVEEVLRYDSPVQVTVRAPLREVELRGVTLRPGNLVVTMLGGANRDPAVFADPQRFDVTRANARDHLAFSGGIHFCLGAGLARAEGSIALRSLFERFPDLALAGTPVRRPMRVLRGYSAMPVALRSGRSVSA